MASSPTPADHLAPCMPRAKSERVKARKAQEGRHYRQHIGCRQCALRVTRTRALRSAHEGTVARDLNSTRHHAFVSQEKYVHSHFIPHGGPGSPGCPFVSEAGSGSLLRPDFRARIN